METKEESQRPAISSFSTDMQIPSEPVWRCVGRIMPKGEKASQTGDEETEVIRADGQGAVEGFLTILFPKPLYVVSSFY